MFGVLIFDLEIDVLDDDVDDEEEVLEIFRFLRVLEQIFGFSMDNLDSFVIGNGIDLIGLIDLFVILKCIKN